MIGLAFHVAHWIFDKQHPPWNLSYGLILIQNCYLSLEELRSVGAVSGANKRKDRRGKAPKMAHKLRTPSRIFSYVFVLRFMKISYPCARCGRSWESLDGAVIEVCNKKKPRSRKERETSKAQAECKVRFTQFSPHIKGSST
jgi:hypothetical protein